MFNRIKNWFRKGGVKLGMIEELNDVTDHPKISMAADEKARINDNIIHYKGDYKPVEFFDADGVRYERDYHSLNMPKILARQMSKLVFNEGVDIKINDNEAADDFIQEVFRKSKFRKNFGKKLEAGYAICGVVLRPYYDKELDTIKISYALPGTFYPLSSSTNDISEMAFSFKDIVTEDKEKIYYTLLEFHEWQNGNYVITNELYRSETASKIGTKVGLKTLDKYRGLQPVSVLKGFSRPLFTYIDLATNNNKNMHSPLGLGVIDNAKQQIKDMNSVYDQFMHEVIDNGASKTMASEHFFRTRFDSKGRPIRSFTRGSSAYRKLKGDEPVIEQFVPELRSNEYIETINFILRFVEVETGFSINTFSFDGQSVKTATEIVSENSETYATRSDNVQIVEEALKELITSIFELAHANNLFTKPADLDIAVDFDDGVFQSTDDKVKHYGQMTTFQFMPRLEAIKRLEGLSDDEAAKWLKMIQQEQMGLDPTEQQAENERDIFGELE